MKILLTGGTGFFGKNLIKILEKSKIKVLVISRKYRKSDFKNIKYLKSDLRLSNNNFNKIKKFNPLIVVNFAWEGIPNFSKKICEKNYNDQVFFFKKILSLNNLKKIISLGSCWEYKKKYGICSENSNLNKSNYFSKSKNNLREFLYKKCKEKNIYFLWFRVFYAFGPHQKNNSLIPYVRKKIVNGKSLEKINLENQNDFIYIKDCCKIIYTSILRKLPSGIYNLGTGKLVSVGFITNLILKYFKKDEIKSRKKLKSSIYASKTKYTNHFTKIKLTNTKNAILETLKSYETS